MSTTADIAITLAPDPNQAGQSILTIDNANNVSVTARPLNGGVVVLTPPPAGSLDPVDHGTFLDVSKIVINGTNADDIISLEDADVPAFINTFNGKDQISLTGIAPTAVSITGSALVTIDAGNGKDLILIQGTVSYNVLVSKGTDTLYLA